MKATTIKVEGELLEELERTEPPRQSLSAYVRVLLQQAVDSSTAATKFAPSGQLSSAA